MNHKVYSNGRLSPLLTHMMREKQENQEPAEELQRLHLDAARYRWLRENGHEAIGGDRGMGPEWTYYDELDALVDAAIAKHD